MLRQALTVSFIALTELASLNCAAVRESKEAGGKNQITNSVGMKLVLIPAGELMTGSRESSAELAKMFVHFEPKFEVEQLAEWFEHERPQHRVPNHPAVPPRRHLATVGQFRKFVADGGYVTDGEKGEKKGAAGSIQRRGSSRSIRGTPGGKWVSSRPTSTP